MGVRTRYVGGPCNGKWQELENWRPPPMETRCGSPRPVTYVVRPDWSGDGVYVYVVKGSRNDGAEESEVRGRRDVFQAFRRLMGALANDSPKQLRRVHRAGKRIRRAVR